MSGKVSLPKWKLGGLISVGVLLLAVVIISLPRGGGDSSSSSSASAAAGGTGGASSAAGCAGAGVSADESVRDRAPKGTQWVTTDSGWTGPVSSSVGPKTKDPFRRCFEHSAEGALYAAAWTLVQINDPEVRNAALDQALTGPGRVAAKESLLKSKARNGESSFQLGGYKYLSFSSDRASIRVMIQTSSGEWRSMDMVMVWENGDWRLHVPADARSSISRVTDPSQFIRWRA